MGEIMEIMAVKEHAGVTARRHFPGEAGRPGSSPDPSERGASTYRRSHHAPVVRAFWQQRNADQIAVWSRCSHVS